MLGAAASSSSSSTSSVLRLLVLSLAIFVVGFQYYFYDSYYLNYLKYYNSFQIVDQPSSSLSSSGSTTTSQSSSPQHFEQQQQQQQQKLIQKIVSNMEENNNYNVKLQQQQQQQQNTSKQLPLRVVEENENENGGDGSSSSSSDDDDSTTTAQTQTAEAAFEDEEKVNNNNKGEKKKYSLKQVITNPEIQGYHIPQDMIDWNLHYGSSSSPSRNFTKTLCTVSNHPKKYSSNQSSSTTKRKFFLKVIPYSYTNSSNKKNNNNNKEEWEVVEVQKDRHINETNDFCENSLIRKLRGPKQYNADGSPPENEKPSDRLMLLKRLEAHIEGEQLTTPIIKRASQWAGKPVISKTITNSNNPLLIDAIPITRIFNSTQHCQDFCDGEWLETTTTTTTTQSSKWIWKPTTTFGGKGIMMIDDLESCHNHCTSMGGSNLQAQVVSDTMYLNDGRKFDIRTHILIANVHPLIVYVGAERIRICAESSKLNNTQVTPFPGLPINSTWNPFQQVCNLHVGLKHPIKGVWTPEKNLGSLRDGIPDNTTRRRVNEKLDNFNKELITLLAKKFQYDGKVGMFQMFASDFLVDRLEKLWFLELNQSPGHTDTGKYYPNPWGDVFNIEWTILQTYQEEFKFSNSNNDAADDWTAVLDQRLSELDLETLRRVI